MRYWPTDFEMFTRWFCNFRYFQTCITNEPSQNRVTVNFIVHLGLATLCSIEHIIQLEPNIIFNLSLKGVIYPKFKKNPQNEQKITLKFEIGSRCPNNITGGKDKTKWSFFFVWSLVLELLSKFKIYGNCEIVNSNNR